MDYIDWIIQNKELIKIFYGIIISIICLIILYKSHRLFHISSYDGIRYFRNAFLFFAAAFFIRYIMGGISFYGFLPQDFILLIKILFEYFIVMAGFFLVYSMFWKKFEYPKGSYSSLLNGRIAIFYFMSLCIVLLDMLWEVYYFMFFSQIILFLFASILSCINYKKKGDKSIFLKYYFIAMVLTLVAWLLNTIAPSLFNWDQWIMIGVYIINIVIFLMFLVGVIRITKRPKSKF